MPFEYTPSTGLNDTSSFPSKDTNFRAHLQSLLDQPKDYINNSLENTASLAINGWFKDKKTGLLEQWGLVSGTLNSGTYSGIVNFNIAFPNRCTHVFGSITNGGGADEKAYRIATPNPTLTQFPISIDNNGIGGGYAFTVLWRAIGY